MSSPPRSDAYPAQIAELGDADREDMLALLDQDPIVNAMLRARVDAVGALDPRRLAGSMFGVRNAGGQLCAAAFSGGNLLTVGGRPPEWQALAELLGRRRRVCSSIVGRVEAVSAMWPTLADAWGPARAIRHRQPLLVIERDDAAAASHEAAARRRFPPVRRVRPAELTAYLPAAEAMFAEEIGIVPTDGGGRQEYRRRVDHTIREGRAFAVLDDTGAVLFKADIAAITAHTCQIQGVWTRPDLRGRGLASEALAALLRHAFDLAPSVSLYVNDFNAPALRVYRRLGMRPVATLSTVLF